MNNININDIINNGGATLTRELEHTNYTQGYMVSIQGMEKTYSLEDTTNILKGIEEYQEYLTSNNYTNGHIGLWVYDNKLYLDISLKIDNVRKAIKEAKANKQLALYDNNNEECIMLDNITIQKTYDILDNRDMLLCQFDTLEEVAKYLNVPSKRVSDSICKHERIHDIFKIDKLEFIIDKNELIANF